MIRSASDLDFGADLSEWQGKPYHHAPLRPGMPILLLCALAMWGSAAMCYMQAKGSDLDSLIVAIVVSAVGCLVFLIGFALIFNRGGFASKVSKVLIALSFLMLGVMLGAIGSASYAKALEGAPVGNMECDLRLVSDMSKSSFGYSATAVAKTQEGESFKVRAAFSDDFTELYAGARIKAKVRFSEVSESYSEQSYLSGICANVAVEDAEEQGCDAAVGRIYGVRKAAIELIGENGGDSAALLQALICGYRSPMSQSGEYDIYKQCGLAHIVAVSGAHLAIVTAAFGSILKILRCPRRVALAANSVFVLGYLVFSGIPISAVRASVMAILSLSSGAFGRRSASLNALAVCIIAFIGSDITASVSVSFFLSAGSTLGIVLFSSLLASWMGSSGSGIAERTEAIGKGVIEPLALTFASNLATLPFSVAVFSQLPLVAPLANIVATPMFTVGCSFGLAATLASCALPAIAPVAIGAAGIIVWPLREASSLLAHVPYGCVAVEANPVAMVALSALLMVLLWVVWPKTGKAALFCICAAFMALAASVAIKATASHGTEVVMLDVGQGDALLVRSGASSMLVDTGNNDSKLVSELLDEGVVHLDAVLITHPDDDHCGSLGALCQYADVGTLVVASDMLECTCDKCISFVSGATMAVGSKPSGVDVGDVISFGGFSFSVVWPHDYEDDGGNGDSLCLDAKIDGDGDGIYDYRMLFTGDAESEQLEAMLDGGAIDKVDVLKVGHHGSKASLNDSLVQALDPKIALISVGAGNRYDHPASDVLQLLESVGADVHRTDQEGRVRISFMGSGIEVK